MSPLAVPTCRLKFDVARELKVRPVEGHRTVCQLELAGPMPAHAEEGTHDSLGWVTCRWRTLDSVALSGRNAGVDHEARAADIRPRLSDLDIRPTQFNDPAQISKRPGLLLGGRGIADIGLAVVTWSEATLYQRTVDNNESATGPILNKDPARNIQPGCRARNGLDADLP